MFSLDKASLMYVVIIVRTATGIVMYCPTAAGVLSKRCHGVHAWRSSGAGTAGDVHVQFIVWVHPVYHNQEM